VKQRKIHEESYRERIPENLSCGPPAEAADEVICLDEAIDALEGAYAV
jgi:hypothetical protein